MRRNLVPRKGEASRYVGGVLAKDVTAVSVVPATMTSPVIVQIAQQKQTTVTLAAPLGSRAVLDGAE